MSRAHGYAGTLQERFDRKWTPEPNSGCWLWLGAIDTRGYGQMRVDGRGKIATHVALELAGLPRPDDRPFALHRCDNPSCVNPDHLWWGTQLENVRDCQAKGRFDGAGLELGRSIPAAPKPIATCTNCSTKFETSVARVAVNKRHFCSTECSRTWQSAAFKGAKRADFGTLDAAGAPKIGAAA